MHSLRTVLLVLSLAAPLAAQNQPQPDTPEQAANKVLVAFKAKDEKALKALAEKDQPDPWLVADELCFRQAHDAAESFAKAAQRKDVEKLPAYVASQRGKAPNAAARKALIAAEQALGKKNGEGALATLERVHESAADVVSVRFRFARGGALYALRRFQESEQAFSDAAEAAERLGWLVRAARALREAGKSAWYRADYGRALACWERHLAIEESRANGAGMGIALRNIGLVHEVRGAWPLALRCYEHALKLAKDAGDEETVAWALQSVGGVHRRRGDYATALQHFGRSLELARKRHDKETESFTLAHIGDLHEKLGEYDKALEFDRWALTLARERQDRQLEASVLGDIGLVHHRRGEWSQALASHEQALELQEDLEDRPGIAATLGNIGLVHENRGDYLKALEFQERALEAKEKLEDPAEIAITLGNLGIVHQRLGDYPKALDFHRRSLKRLDNLDDRAGVARTLGNIGRVYCALGDFHQALEDCRHALELSRKLNDRAGIARGLSYVGIVHQELGNYAKALELQERALEFRKELRDHPGVARTLGNLGNVYRNLGDYSKALEFQERALERKRSLGDRAGVAATLGNIGGVHRNLGDRAKALEFQQHALELTRKLGDRAGTATSLTNLGLIHEDSKEYPKALECYEGALEIERELGDRAGMATVLSNIGSIHWKLGDHARALDYGARALALAEEVASQEGVARCRWFLAVVHLTRGHPRRAAAEARLAVDAMSGLVRGLAGQEGATARGRWTPVFEVGVRAGIAIGDPAEVSRFVENGRAGTLLESLRGRRTLGDVAIPEKLLREENEARVAFVAAQARLGRALKEGNREEEIRETRAALDKARGRVLEVATRIQRAAKAAADVVYPKAAPLKTLRGSLAQGEALVLYALLSKEAVALVITAEDARIVELGATRTIEGAARALRDAVGHAGDRGVAVASGEVRTEMPLRLRALVVEPLGLGKEIRRVLVSPHGLLANVPFALLMQDKEVVYVPSGTTYRVLLDEQAKRGEGVLALGDPDYGVEPDPRAVAVMRLGAKLKRLPETAKEAKAVGDVVLVGARSTEATLANAMGEQRRWRAVHLACHGLVRTDQPQLSSLALTPDAEHDGFLTVLEVFRMKIPADLVILSACETAKGKIYKAEGILGFTRAFMLAGAPRVIVSLWKVHDEATRALMVKFYELWKPGKMATATALKQAQEYVRSHEKWKHPYYWAAWQLWGLPE
ncbi:MAG: tetratricopeptide repeat protein [Planctomycetota bacterium]|jgi:tetratricopeptide (TPR) repeat protein/CHAT domain-containing protein